MISIAMMVVSEWIILLISFILYEMRGSFVYLLRSGMHLTSDDFLLFVGTYSGRPIDIKIVIPYLPSHFSSFYEPFISTMVCLSLFWVICGVISGSISKSLREGVLGAISQYVSFVIFALYFNNIYSTASMCVGFSLLMFSMYFSLHYKLLKSGIT